MICRYTFSETIEPARDGEKPDWINLADPDENELAALGRQYQLPAWFFTDPLDPKERPRIDQDGAAVLLVARLSQREMLPDGPVFRTVPVGVILSGEVVITVCRSPDLVDAHLRRLFSRKRHWTRVRLAFALLYASGTCFIETIERMEDLALEAETRLRRQPENEELLALLSIEKSLIDTTVALKSNHVLMDKFRPADALGLPLTKEERDLLDDALTENQQAIFMAEIFGQILAGMSDAFGSIISNNLNKTMKFLAGVTIVLMLPTLIAGLYGMNVALPGAAAPAAFAVLCSVCLALVLAVSILFAKKKWF
ncbi:MAG: magnesium transporter CorA family protein [Candidatus Adiutrix sp.]|jgi:magnesium transporter|nr:magnesium transporter CorA family protein [Candidatus Adiutrix sp.]